MLLGLAVALTNAGLAQNNFTKPAKKQAQDTGNGISAAGDFTELSLEELGAIKVPMVVGASKHEQKITEAPSAVSIVTREDIQQYGYRTLGELLQSVRGFYVTSDRLYNYTGLRGQNRLGDFGGRVLLNIDGHRLNEPVYDSAFTSTEFLLDMDLIERVEVIRGPGSSLYGNNAFFTVINVITRRGRDVRGVEVSGSYGSFDTFTGRLTYGNRFTNGVELIVSGSYLNSEGHERLHFTEFDSVNNGVAEDLDDTRTGNVFASLSYGDFTLTGGFINRRKKNPTAQYGSVFNFPETLNIDERGYAELKYAHEFADDWSAQARVYYDYYRYDANFAFNYAAPDPGPYTFNVDHDKAEWFGSELLVAKQLWERHRLTLGGEIRQDLRVELANYDRDPPQTYLEAQPATHSFAFFAQAEIALLTNLTLNAGGRFDHFNVFGDTLNPRGALVWQPWQEGAFKFIYGEAFRAPNIYEFYYIQPSFKSNPSLRPETIRSYELVAEQGLSHGLRTSASLFLNQIKGLIGQKLDTTDDLNFFDNLDAVDARGFEGELEGRWAHGLRARVSYTFTEARDSATGRILDNSPRHLGKLNLALPVWTEKISAGLELQAMSHRTTAAGYAVGPLWLANVTLFSRELIKNLEFSASLYNLFDRRYRDPVSTDFMPIDAMPQDGRAFRVKLMYRF